MIRPKSRWSGAQLTPNKPWRNPSSQWKMENPKATKTEMFWTECTMEFTHFWIWSSVGVCQVFKGRTGTFGRRLYRCCYQLWCSFLTKDVKICLLSFDVSTNWANPICSLGFGDHHCVGWHCLAGLGSLTPPLDVAIPALLLCYGRGVD